MDLKLKIMRFKIILSVCWFVLLGGCSNMSNTNVDGNYNSSAPISNQDIFLSVMNESMVQAQVYMNNLTDQEISSIKYEVFTANNNLTHSLVLIDLNHCVTLAPHSSCLLTFATSSLEYQSNLIMDEKKGDIQLANYGPYLGGDYTLEVYF